MIEVVVITTSTAKMVLLVHIPMNNSTNKMLQHHCPAPTYCQSFANIARLQVHRTVRRIARDPSCTFKKSVHPFANAIPCCGMTRRIMPFRVTRLYIPFHHDRIIIITRTRATRTLAATTRRQRHRLPRAIVFNTIIVDSMKYWRPTITMQS